MDCSYYFFLNCAISSFIILILLIKHNGYSFSTLSLDLIKSNLNNDFFSNINKNKTIEEEDSNFFNGNNIRNLTKIIDVNKGFNNSETQIQNLEGNISYLT